MRNVNEYAKQNSGNKARGSQTLDVSSVKLMESLALIAYEILFVMHLSSKHPLGDVLLTYENVFQDFCFKPCGRENSYLSLIFF